MKRGIFILISLFALIVCGCSTQKNGQGEGKSVKFAIARNYFFNNNAEIPADPKITSQKQFSALLGMAAFMGKGGTPTKIDFTKSFAIGIVLPQTDVSTKIKDIRLAANDKTKTLTASYTIERGKKMTYAIQPCEIVIVDAKYKAYDLTLIPTEKTLE